MKNCVDILRPFNEAVSGRSDIQVIGGIGSAALTDPQTVYAPWERTVITPPDLKLPQHRPDGNLRDFDALVLTTDPAKLREVEAIANETIGDQLEMSIFGLKPVVRLVTQRAEPYKSLEQFVSDRYVMEDDGEVIFGSKALFPFELNIDPETLETWQLYIGRRDKFPTPIPHPATVILNYLTRSVSGLRPKDENKVGQIADNVMHYMPNTMDWLFDGPGQSQIEFARILQRISRPGTLAVGQSLTIKPVPGSLREHPAFMIPDATIGTQALVLATTYAKARGLRFFESQDRLVTLWQKRGEKHVSKMLHND